MSIIEIINNKNKTDEQKILEINTALSQGASLDELDSKQRSVLFCAVESANLMLFKWLIERNPELIKTKGTGNTNILFRALELGKTEIINYLILQAKYDFLMQEVGDKGYTVCHAAVVGAAQVPLMDHLIHLSIFLKKCPTVLNQVDVDGFLPLHSASSIHTAQYLIKVADSNFKFPAKNGATPLLIAAINNQTDIFKYILSCYPESERIAALQITRHDEKNYDVVTHAIERNNLDMLRLAHENKYPFQDNNLLFAARHGSIEAAMFIRSNGTNCSYGMFMVAATYNQRLFFQHFYSPLAESQKREILKGESRLKDTIAHHAAKHNWKFVLEWQHRYQLPFNRPNNKGSHPIHYAAGSGALDAVKFLIETAKVDFKTQENNPSMLTPLQLAINNNHENVFQYLLSLYSVSEQFSLFRNLSQKNENNTPDSASTSNSNSSRMNTPSMQDPSVNTVPEIPSNIAVSALVSQPGIISLPTTTSATGMFSSNNQAGVETPDNKGLKRKTSEETSSNKKPRINNGTN